jgi:hypothetical protein
MEDIMLLEDEKDNRRKVARWVYAEVERREKILRSFYVFLEVCLLIDLILQPSSAITFHLYCARCYAQPRSRTLSRLLVRASWYHGRALNLIQDQWRHTAPGDSARQMKRATKADVG